MALSEKQLCSDHDYDFSMLNAAEHGFQHDYWPQLQDKVMTAEFFILGTRTGWVKEVPFVVG